MYAGGTSFMISLHTAQSPRRVSSFRAPSVRSARRVLVRSLCASAIVALALNSGSSIASAAPGVAFETPLTQSGFNGLRTGAQGTDVTSLQQALIDAGITVPGGADGVFGPATKQAVINYQSTRGLPATGEVDQATSNALSSSATTGAGTTADGLVGLASGSQGPPVTDLQNKLIAFGVYVAGGADGDFGAATSRAVMQFQRWNGLEPTGSVNSATSKKLGLSDTSSPAANPAPATPVARSDNSYLGLRNGAQGNAVKEVQQALIDSGVVVRGGADGAFGNATKTALIAYQNSVGVTADGTVNQATIDKLGLSPVPLVDNAPVIQEVPPVGSSNPYVGLAVGARGELVTELQKALQGTGLVVRGGADGVFGGATKSALQAFQSVNGMSQTGIVTERGAAILALGSNTGDASGVANPNSGVVTLDRFPVQGPCFFGDTWHAPRGGGRQHEGVDVIADEGKLLYAVVDGEITKQYWDHPGALAGNGLRVEQPNGTYFIYLHLSDFAPGIEVGTKVKAGDVIGFIGNTGSSSTAHLHFEIHPNGGSAINPYPYIKAIDGCSNTAAQHQSSLS
jgi:peptidoglycan hydrolase-like protein with peptidoglycan-binding domain